MAGGGSFAVLARLRFANLALGLAVFLAGPTLALAHGVLKSSTPSNGSTVTTALTEIRLEFTEKPELAFTSIQLTGPDNLSVAFGSATITGTTIVFPIQGLLVAGSYRLTWKTAGRDGHPVTGRIGFVVSESAVAPAIAPGSSGPPASIGPPVEAHHDAMSMPGGGAFDAESPGYVVIRWAQFVALLILIGAFAFKYVVLGLLRRREPQSPLPAMVARRLESIVVYTAAMLVTIALVRLIAQSYAMHGENQSVVGAMIPMMTGTTWGIGWIVQVVGCVLILAGLRIARATSKAGWGIAVIGVVLTASSPALSGHAASTPDVAPVAIVADALHIIGAGGWLGSLLFVIIVGIPAAMTLKADEKGNAISSLVNSFSPTALAFAGLAAATGVFAAWLHVGSIPGLWETKYGQTLLWKLGVLSIVAGTGAYNWLRVRPALGKPEGTRRLRYTARVELAVALVVVAITAVLVATPTTVDENMMLTTMEADKDQGKEGN